MKPTVSKKTKAYLDQLEKAEKLGENPGHYHAQQDALDLYIEKHKLIIQRIFFDKELDLMLVALNNREVLKENLSTYPNLYQATVAQCQNYEISPMGIHWPDLNIDLSLKGLLESSLLDIRDQGKVA